MKTAFIAAFLAASVLAAPSVADSRGGAICAKTVHGHLARVACPRTFPLLPRGVVCVKSVKGKLVHVACPKAKPKPRPATPPAPTPPTTTVTTPPPPPLGSRANPYPLGTAARVGDYTVTVNSVDFDAWPLVQAANMFNDPPAAGWNDVLVSLTMTYNGTGTGHPWIDNEMKYVGAGNVGYPTSGFDHYCGVAPSPELSDFNDVFAGGTVTGNVCFQAQASDVSSLVAYWTPFLSSTTYWFALR